MCEKVKGSKRQERCNQIKTKNTVVASLQSSQLVTKIGKKDY